MKKTDVRIKRTQNQLYNALIELLKEKSFEEITIMEICTTAEIHRATFYKHYADKYDFLLACLKMKLEELNLGTLDTSYTRQTMKTSCMKMISSLISFVQKNEDLLVSIKHSGSSWNFISVLNDAVSRFIVERLMTLENLSGKLDARAQMIASYYAGALVNLVRWWIDAQESCDTEELMKFAEMNIDNLCKYFDDIANE